MPALPHYTPVFSVDKAAWTPMLTDPTSGSATYGTKILLNGITTVSFDPEVLYKEAFGDNAIQHVASKARKFMCKAGLDKFDLDFFAQILGGTVTDAGTTPAQTTTYDILNTSASKYGKFEAQVLGVEVPGPSGGGDLHFVFWKAKMMAFSAGASAENFSSPSFEFAVLARVSDGKMASIVENETAVSL